MYTHIYIYIYIYTFSYQYLVIYEKCFFGSNIYSHVTNDWYQFGLDFEGTSTYNTGSTLASNYDGSVFITGSNPFGTPGRTGLVRGYSSYDFTLPT